MRQPPITKTIVHVETHSADEPRNGAVDFLRAAMVVYIVGYWHLLAYVGSGVDHVNWVTDSITNVVLGTFTFLSGYALGKWRGELSAANVRRFYVRRLLRIYPLYVLALVGFVALWLTDSATAIRAVFLISMFAPPAPMTLWFITMIMAFYFLVPFLAQPRPRIGLCIAAALWLTMLTCHVFVRPVDVRVLMYFPCFAAGILFRTHGDRVREVRLPSVGVAFAAAFGATAFKDAEPLRDALLQIPAVALGATFMLLVGERYLRSAGSWKPIQLLSHAGLTLYLFHRVVFTLTFRFVQPTTKDGQLLLLLFVAFPASIVTAAAIQAAYDRALAWSVRRLAG